MMVPGSITAFSGEIDPTSYRCTSGLWTQKLWFGPNPRNNTGWILCDGSTFSIALFPDLFAVIGNAYGTDSGAPKVPDYGGYFLRSISRDKKSPANSDRKPYVSGSSFTVGQTQKDMLILHSHHTYKEAVGEGELPASQILPTPPTASKAKVYAFPPGATTGTEVKGEETRPINVYVNYLIYAGKPATSIFNP